MMEHEIMHDFAASTLYVPSSHKGNTIL